MLRAGAVPIAYRQTSQGNNQTGTGPTARRRTLSTLTVTYGLYKDVKSQSKRFNARQHRHRLGHWHRAEYIVMYGRVIASRTPAALWAGRLSMTTTSPSDNVGTSTCST
jgi:hypothetical protein